MHFLIFFSKGKHIYILNYITLPTPATPKPTAVLDLPGSLLTIVASRKAYPPKEVKAKAPVILHGKQSS